MMALLFSPWSETEGGAGGGVSQQHTLECSVLQGAILSPVFFNICMCPLTQIVQRHGLECHQNADDSFIC